MTECERFVKEGRFSQSFFEEEYRNDFFCDRLRKQIWAVELDMLLFFDEICKKHDLKYWLWSGSLLGAIRHGGFIPWDDDLDIVMFREDYNKMLEITKELPAPYFMQTVESDPETGYSHAKMRNNNTCAFNKFYGYRDVNLGIWLDIFPFDTYYEPGLQERFEEIDKRNVELALYMKKVSPYKNERDIKRLSEIKVRKPIVNYREIQEIATRYNDVETGLAMTITDSGLKLHRNCFFVSDFAETEYVPFEGFMLPVPKGWKRVLIKLFGDYMQFPPIESRVNKHFHTIFYPDKPFALIKQEIAGKTEAEQLAEAQADPFYEIYREYGRKKIAEER